MKDTKTHVLRHLQKFQTKKTLKCHLALNFNNFQKGRGEITIDFYNILTIGINIIEFYVNIISDLSFTIILYLYPLYNFLKGDSFDFFLVNSQLI